MVIRDLHQIQIRIADVDRTNPAGRPRARDGPGDDGDIFTRQMRANFVYGCSRDQTEIRRSWRRLEYVWIGNCVGLMQVDLLPAECERHACLAVGFKVHDIHAQNTRVKRATRGDIGDSQNKMIDMVNGNHAAIMPA